MSTDAKVWCENGTDEMSQLRAFTQNGGDVYEKIIDISTKEKRNKKIERLEKRIRNKAKRKILYEISVSGNSIVKKVFELLEEGFLLKVYAISKPIVDLLF